MRNNRDTTQDYIDLNHSSLLSSEISIHHLSGHLISGTLRQTDDLGSIHYCSVPSFHFF